MEEAQTKSKQLITFSQVLQILGIFVIPLILYGVSVEVRFNNHAYRIDQNEKKNGKVEQKIDRIDMNTLNILLEIERLKKNLTDEVRENRTPTPIEKYVFSELAKK